jgi:TM2 domain-containing membrane protein YozV
MDNKIVFGILNIMFNSIGVPSFLVGDKSRGIKTIIFGILIVPAILNAIKGIINGIKIIKMDDEEFAAADKASLIDAIPVPKAAEEEEVEEAAE